MIRVAIRTFLLAFFLLGMFGLATVAEKTDHKQADVYILFAYNIHKRASCNGIPGIAHFIKPCQDPVYL